MRDTIGRFIQWPLCMGLFAALFGGSFAANGQEPGLDQIDTLVRAEMARQKVPGLAIAVVQNGNVLAAKGYGLANVEHQVAVGPDTIFQSGSLGKQFTAVAVMLLVEQQKIRLEDTVTNFFPDAPPAWREITVRHLLTHTSGIPDYEGAESGSASASVDFRRDYSEEELTQFAFNLTLEFPPGSRWNYSNTGYVLLGVIIHKVAGQFYGDLLRERVFAPLGMATARVISEADIVSHRAAGYRLENGDLKNQHWVSPTFNTTADGALYLSVRDLIAWDKALRAGAILASRSWSQVYAPVVLNSGNTYPYGFGWFVDTVNGSRRLHHRGAWQGFKAQISRYLDEDLTIIVLANLAEADTARFVDGIAGGVAPVLAPKELTTISDREPDVTARLETLLRLAKEGQLSASDLAYVRAGFFPEIARAYQERLSALGAIQRVSLLDRKLLGDDRVYTYEISYATGSQIVTIGLVPDGKLSLFSIEPKLPRPGG